MALETDTVSFTFVWSTGKGCAKLEFVGSFGVGVVVVWFLWLACLFVFGGMGCFFYVLDFCLFGFF